MRFKLCVYLVCFLQCIDSEEVRFTQKHIKASIGKHQPCSFSVPKTRMVKGVEFSDLARGPLLKLLSAYEEQLKNRLTGKKLKPIFTVQFANNVHTNKFIYPDMRKKVIFPPSVPSYPNSGNHDNQGRSYPHKMSRHLLRLSETFAAFHMNKMWTGQTSADRKNMKSSPGTSSSISAAGTAAASTPPTQKPPSLSIDTVPPDELSFFSGTSLIQFGYGVWLNMTYVVVGLAFGFTSAAIPMLRKETSISMNLSEESWIAGSITLCAPVGSLLAGYIMDKYGRKHMIAISEAPVVLGWFCIGFAKNPTYIIIGRLIIGIGIGIIFIAPRTYLTEISLPNMRGINGAIPTFALALGLIIMAILAVFLQWRMLCHISAAYSIILLLSYVCIPETPHFLLMTSPEKAKKALQKFRSKSYDVEAEMKMLLVYRDKNQIHSLTVREKFVSMFEASVYKPFLISFTYIILTQLAGVYVVVMWNVEMLEMCHSSIDAQEGYVIICITRFVFGVLASIVVYKYTRRGLAIVSAIGVGLSSLAICIDLYAQVGMHITPLIFYNAYIAFGCLGYYTVPFVMMSELLPLQHRGFLCGVNMTSMNFMIFGMNKSYPYMREAIGLANVMAIYGGLSLLAAIILFAILPETSKMTLQEIEEHFKKKRPIHVGS